MTALHYALTFLAVLALLVALAWLRDKRKTREFYSTCSYHAPMRFRTHQEWRAHERGAR